jgi:hypothetical protein
MPDAVRIHIAFSAAARTELRTSVDRESATNAELRQEFFSGSSGSLLPMSNAVAMAFDLIGLNAGARQVKTDRLGRRQSIRQTDRNDTDIVATG